VAFVANILPAAAVQTISLQRQPRRIAAFAPAHSLEPMEICQKALSFHRKLHSQQFGRLADSAARRSRASFGESLLAT
jgi:hypothetical protein